MRAYAVREVLLRRMWLADTPSLDLNRLAGRLGVASRELGFKNASGRNKAAAGRWMPGVSRTNTAGSRLQTPWPPMVVGWLG